MHDLFLQISGILQNYGVQGLALNAFIESFFLFPPPDFLLITMDLANPDKALYYAFIGTVASAAGGAFGYLIGLIGGRPVCNFLFRNKRQYFDNAEVFYKKYGACAVFFSAVTPVPYNIFNLTSGILKMNFLQFIIAGICGRALRFFLVSTVLMLFGETIKEYLNWVILGVSIILVIFFVILYKKRNILK